MSEAAGINQENQGGRYELNEGSLDLNQRVDSPSTVERRDQDPDLAEGVPSADNIDNTGKVSDSYSVSEFEAMVEIGAKVGVVLGDHELLVREVIGDKGFNGGSSVNFLSINIRGLGVEKKLLGSGN
ncbi:hypothetical protein HanXRQr2_Chr09g0372211 [Helianthus annuus]|uniref:Uncharacterized protein n=1 Tax=Helianthus annuus TaxID=4232 RepID=A0A9K3I317_HELAN|nr:hypothetical protein HanXRQr2_Chr09g0372211 [Helianthus annuus]